MTSVHLNTQPARSNLFFLTNSLEKEKSHSASPSGNTAGISMDGTMDANTGPSFFYIHVFHTDEIQNARKGDGGRSNR